MVGKSSVAVKTRVWTWLSESGFSYSQCKVIKFRILNLEFNVQKHVVAVKTRFLTWLSNQVCCGYNVMLSSLHFELNLKCDGRQHPVAVKTGFGLGCPYQVFLTHMSSHLEFNVQIH